MLNILILGAALLAQAPDRPTEADLAARTAAMRADIQARAAASVRTRRIQALSRDRERVAREAAMTPRERATRAASLTAAYEAGRRQRAEVELAERAERRERMERAGMDREAREKAEAQYRAEEERMARWQLEQQRQMFYQQAEMERLRLEAERNQILDRGLSHIYRGTYAPPSTSPIWWPR